MRVGEELGDFGEEGFTLNVAVGAEAGADAVEVGVVVAGMAADLVSPGGREGREELSEGGSIELAGGRDGDGAVGGEDAALVESEAGLEAGAQASEELDGEAARGAALVQRETPRWFKGTAYGSDGGLFGDFEEWARDGGRQMRVLVCIEVGDVDAGALELLNLGKGFAGDVFCADAAAKERLNEIEQGRAKGFAVGAEETGDCIGRRDGNSIGEDDVAADAEGWVSTGDGDGVVEGWAVGHEGCRGEDAGGVELADGAVDAGSEAEVVGVEDEARGHC